MLNRPLVCGLLCASLGMPAAEAGAPARPDFSGTWRFVPSRSEDVRAAVLDAAGPEYTQGSSKLDVDRVQLRQLLLRILDCSSDSVVVIEQSSTELEISLDDEVASFYFGREAKRENAYGERLRISLRWEADTLVAEERGEKGTRIVRSLSLLPDRRELVMALVWEAKPLRKPLDVRLVFARAEQGPNEP